MVSITCTKSSFRKAPTAARLRGYGRDMHEIDVARISNTCIAHSSDNTESPEFCPALQALAYHADADPPIQLCKHLPQWVAFVVAYEASKRRHLAMRRPCSAVQVHGSNGNEFAASQGSAHVATACDVMTWRQGMVQKKGSHFWGPCCFGPCFFLVCCFLVLCLVALLAFCCCVFLAFCLARQGFLLSVFALIGFLLLCASRFFFFVVFSFLLPALAFCFWACFFHIFDFCF